VKIFFCETFDDGTVGGSHACMYNLISHLDRTQLKCTVGFYSDNAYVPLYRDKGVDVTILPMPKPIRDGNVIRRKAINWYYREYMLKRHIEDYFRGAAFSLVVLNNSIYASLPIVSVCRRLSIPVIVYERGIGFLKKEHVRASAHVQALVPISDAVYDFLCEYKVRTKVIRRIYDGIDPSKYAPSRMPAQIKADLNIPPVSKVIGIVGNIRPWKGQHYFVEAFGSLATRYQDIYGLVIGGCAEEDQGYLDGLKKKVERMGLKDRLLFLGYRKDVSNLLSIMDVFVHASVKPEPFGMVILEAMASKAPVVATKLGGPLEILSGEECGILVPPQDSGAIADACARYLGSPSFTEKVVQNAKERVFGRFHIRKTVEESMRLFTDVYEAGL
jgi:glycosyltransferase involved in cell wall biosynthesis